MDCESEFDLEGEVLEFLLAWSSTSPDVDTPRPVVLCPPLPVDRLQARFDPPCPLERGFAFAKMPCRSRGKRGSQSAVGRTYRDRDAFHPYYNGIRRQGSMSALAPYYSSYAAELKATARTKYLNLKEGMDRVWGANKS